MIKTLSAKKTLEKLSILNALVGITKGNPVSLEEAKMERILRRAYPGEDTCAVNQRLEAMGRLNAAESIPHED